MPVTLTDLDFRLNHETKIEIKSQRFKTKTLNIGYQFKKPRDVSAPRLSGLYT